MNKWLDERVDFEFRRTRVWVNQETDLICAEVIFYDCPDIAMLFKLTWC